MTTMTANAAAIASLPIISKDDAMAMYRDLSLHELGRRAMAVTQTLHPEPYRTFVVDRNINYSNYCTAKCSFCNFKVDPGDADGYVLSFEEIGQKIEELLAIGGTQVLMQGGLVPAEDLPFQWYLDLLRFIRSKYPTIHIHAFSPPEIFAFSQIFNMSIRDVLLRLRDAGLHTIPGGGTEILSDRVRRKIGYGKTLTGEYLEVMREAHLIGMRTSVTMMFGHIETLEERFEHLALVRELQNETGGISAYICWTYQPENTILGRAKQPPPDAQRERDGKLLVLADATEYLRMLAISRIFLHNVCNIQSSWVTQGPKVGQLALYYGANDMGSVMMEENVVSAAGTTYRMSEAELRRSITDAGWIPKKRNGFYEILD